MAFQGSSPEAPRVLFRVSWDKGQRPKRNEFLKIPNVHSNKASTPPPSPLLSRPSSVVHGLGARMTMFWKTNLCPGRGGGGGGRSWPRKRPPHEAPRPTPSPRTITVLLSGSARPLRVGGRGQRLSAPAVASRCRRCCQRVIAPPAPCTASPACTPSPRSPFPHPTPYAIQPPHRPRPPRFVPTMTRSMQLAVAALALVSFLCGAAAQTVSAHETLGGAKTLGLMCRPFPPPDMCRPQANRPPKPPVAISVGSWITTCPCPTTGPARYVTLRNQPK